MTVLHEQLILESNGVRVSYHNVTEDIKKIVNKAGIKNGICVVATPHTTCSVLFEEYVHDHDWNGDEFLQVDLNRILNRLIPRQLTESDYLYPGPEHVQFLKDLAAVDSSYPADPATILNADAHIRASIFGSSETFIIKDGEMQIGSVGYIYFIDWDQNRKRKRKCNILLMGE